MQLEIRVYDQCTDKNLYLDGVWYASWSADVKDEVIYQNAVNTAYMLGKEKRSQEIRNLIMERE